MTNKEEKDTGFAISPQAAVGRLSGGINYSAVSVARKRLRLRMKSDATLKQELEDVADKLSILKI
ncbi:MAG: hypothetical protein U5L07_09810 [Desulfobacterales bacterium]|nr:hypothetical protein [Desulfobacterales bacterium]